GLPRGPPRPAACRRRRGDRRDPAPGRGARSPAGKHRPGPLPVGAISLEQMISVFTLIFISRTGNLDIALGWAGSRQFRHRARKKTGPEDDRTEPKRF